jgi:hypothetical protein
MNKNVSNAASRRLAVTLLCVAVITGVFCRWCIISHKTIIQHDEGISYLAATGHQNEYEQLLVKKTSPYGRFVPASEWKRLIQPEKQFIFGEIRQGLEDTDNHPPLYFWLLHLWVLVFGVSIQSGPALNLIFFVLSLLILFRTASIYLREPVEAGWACLLFAVSPAVMFLGFEARQYELLSTIVIAFVALTTRYLEASSPSKRWDAALFLVTTAGLLTHYMFMFVALGALILGTVMLVRRGWKRLLKLYLPMALALPAFWAVHPRFWRSFFRQQESAQPFAWADLPYRFDRAAYALAQFFSPRELFPHLGLAAFIIVVLGVIGLAAYKPLRDKVGRIEGPDHNRLWFVFAYWFFWNGIFTLALYFTFVSQRHTVGPKYFYGVWPFLAVTVILLCRIAPKRKNMAAALVVAFVACNGVYTGLTYKEQPKRGEIIQSLFESSGAILVDDPSRGILLRFLYYMPDDKSLFIAFQEDLLKNAAAWKDNLPPRALYVNSNAYLNSKAKRDRVLAVIRQTRNVREIGGGFLAAGTCYLIE